MFSKIFRGKGKAQQHQHTPEVLTSLVPPPVIPATEPEVGPTLQPLLFSLSTFEVCTKHGVGSLTAFIPSTPPQFQVKLRSGQIETVHRVLVISRR